MKFSGLGGIRTHAFFSAMYINATENGENVVYVYYHLIYSLFQCIRTRNVSVLYPQHELMRGDPQIYLKGKKFSRYKLHKQTAASSWSFKNGDIETKRAAVAVVRIQFTSF